METLGELIACQDSACDYEKRCGRDPARGLERGFAPLNFGGSNGSHHGATATKLAKRGLVEQRKRGYEWGGVPKGKGGWYRGSKVYRPTQAGRELFEVWRQAQRDGGDPVEIMGKTK